MTADLKEFPRHGDKRPAATDLWEPPSPGTIIPNTKVLTSLSFQPPRRYSRTRTKAVGGRPEIGQAGTGRNEEKAGSW